MSIEGWIALGTSGAAIIALAYAVYQGWSARSDARDWANQLVATGKAQVQSERNALDLERDRDSQKVRADKAEAELADVTARLISTQAALAKAEQENTDAASKAVLASDDPLAALNAGLQAKAGPDLPAAGAASAGHGDQGKPAV